MTEFWRLRSAADGSFVVVNPDAVDEMYPDERREFGTVIILRSGRVVEVQDPLGDILELVKLTIS